MKARRPFLAGNWKMNLDRAGAVALARAVADHAARRDGIDVAIFPPFVYLAAVAEAVRGSRLRVGAQDLYYERKGAFTGEVSAEMIRDVGGTLSLVGHSERRHAIGEGDDLVARKLRACLDGGLDPILCVGETLAEREAGKTNSVLERQVRSAFAGARPEEVGRVTVAYEPVWAIGTGRNATPEQAGEAHAFVRGLLRSLFGEAVAGRLRIQYGGSVTPENARDLLAVAEVDGALVGGASLDAGKFAKILDFDR